MNKISKSRIILTIFGIFICLLSFSRDNNALQIPDIDLSTPVATLGLTNNQLETPNRIVGSYTVANKTLLIGHASSIFKNLSLLQVGAEIFYNKNTYQVTDIYTLEKSAISMAKLLTPSESDSLILMTCAGTYLPDNDATHRLIIIAERSN